MSKRVLFHEAEIAEPADFSNATLFALDALDSLIDDAIAYPAHWAGMTVSATANAQEVRVSAGRYFADRLVYEQAAAVDVNLLTHLPVVTSDERWVALILRGRVETVSQERAFETSTDPETSIPVVRSVPKIEARSLTIVVQQGLATPAPAVKPVVAETDCCVAFVRLKSSGVQEIVMGESWRVKPLAEVEGRVTAIEINLASLFLRAETLETDLANANAEIGIIKAGLIRPEIFREVRRDVAALRRKLDVPEEARATFYDPALLLDSWDFTIALGQNFRIDEGIQFPFVESREARLEIQNEDSPLIRLQGRRMMPVWDKVKRIANEGGRATRLISQVTHTEIEAIKRTISRTKTVYGPTVNVCENAAEWSRYSAALRAGSDFSKNGETFVVVAHVADNGKTANGYVPGHNVYAVRTKSTKTYTETYWDYQPNTVGLNGSVYGQTFLVSQPIICPSVELELAKVGSDGDISVFFCECDQTGAPVISRVVAQATILAKDLRLGWNEFVADLTYFEPGQRYAWFAVTTGNHQLYGTDDNAFAGGTSFRFTDGAWAQGDLTFDFNFRINGCRFRNTRTVIEFKAMSLPGGMTQFGLLYPNWAPEGSAISWEIQPVFGGPAQPWSTLDAGLVGHPLANLPAQVNLRATFLSTPDLAPMIELSADAVYEAARVGNNLRALTDPIDLGLTTTAIETLTVVDDFDPAIHTFTPRIMIGNGPALISPDSTTATVDADKPSRRTFLSRYTVPAGTRIVRSAPGGTTSSITNVFFGQNTALFAL